VPVFIIEKPGRCSFVRKGECLPILGRVRLLRGEGPVQEIYVKIGRRRISCDLQPIAEEQGAEWRFEAMYRVGSGIKIMVMGCRLKGDDKDKIYSRRIILSGREEVGRSPYLVKSNRILPGFNLIGPLQYQTGLGEAARGSVRALVAADIPHVKVVAPLVLNAPKGKYYSRSELGDSLSYRINLFHLNGPEMSAVAKHWPRVLRSSQYYNIAFWVFELERIPQAWVPHFEGLNEIWTPSVFARDAIAALSPIPVYVVPTPIVTSTPEGATKAEFALPEDKICVLVGFDLNSYRHRKNPDAAIAAFKNAWSQDQQLHLVLKVGNADKNWQAMNELRASLTDVPAVTYVTQTLPREKMTRLQAACDIYLSLHRSEGFGLHLTECMALGKPVVATDWSANRDYLDVSNGVPVPYRLVEISETFGPYEKGQLWAEPDIEYATKALLALAADPVWRANLGACARARINALYSVESVATAVRARIQSIAVSGKDYI
jgi:glycosyltransferase involved in cell wall biosynthesis